MVTKRFRICHSDSKKKKKMVERFVIRIPLYTIILHYITSKNICCLCVKLMLHSGPIRNVLRTWVGTLYPFSEPSKLCIYSQSDQEHFHPDIYREEFVSDFFWRGRDGWMCDCMSGEIREKFRAGGKRGVCISWLCSGISLARGWRWL